MTLPYPTSTPTSPQPTPSAGAPATSPSAAPAPAVSEGSPSGTSGPHGIRAAPPPAEDSVEQITQELKAGRITVEEAKARLDALKAAGTITTPTGAPDLNLPDFGNLGLTATTVDPTVSAGQQAYEAIWGVTPPNGYIESLVKQGLNVYQIQLHELSQPGANRTQYWRDTEASVAQQLATLMGRR